MTQSSSSSNASAEDAARSELDRLRARHQLLLAAAGEVLSAFVRSRLHLSRRNTARQDLDTIEAFKTLTEVLNDEA